MLRRDAILAAADLYSGTRAAAGFVLLMLENGLPGECEGHLPCYLARADQLEGEYLRRFPNGARVRTVLRELFAATPFWRGLAASPRLFAPTTDCLPLSTPLAALRAAVAAAEIRDLDAAYQTELLDALDELSGVCLVG